MKNVTHDSQVASNTPCKARRIKGKVYMVKSEWKKWDGKRFARCCKLCNKLAQGNTYFCKGHGGGLRCAFVACTKASRGSSMLCASHGGGRRCVVQSCKSAAIESGRCRAHMNCPVLNDASEQSAIPEYLKLLD